MAGKPPAGPRKYEDEKLASTYLVGKSGADMHEDELARKRGRKTIVIAAGVLLALALVGTAVGLGVGLSKRNDNRSSNKNKLVIGSNSTPASSSSASVADLKYLPEPDTPEAQNLRQNGSPEVKLMYQLADDAKTITPDKVVEFLDYVDSIAHLKDKGVDLDYFKDQAGSIAHWLRAKGYTAVLDVLRKFSKDGKLDTVALAGAAEQLLGVLKNKGDFRSWMNWPGGSDDKPMPEETMTRRKKEDKDLDTYMAKAGANTYVAPAGVNNGANRRKGTLLANPFLQYQNVYDPKGWMNNPASLGYPGFKPIVIPVVFHLLMFNDKQGYLGPRNAYSRKDNPGRYLINLMNKAYKATNIQFRLDEWRNDPKKPKWKYLNLGSVDAWQSCATRAESCTCPLAAKYNKDPRRTINIWVSGSDGYPGMGDSVDIAYSSLIPNVMDTCRDKLGWKTSSSKSRHLWFLWDQVDPDYQNNEAAYNDGAATIIHEVGHQLGLLHTHQGDCSNLDDINDTPPNRVVQDASYYDTLTRVCIAAWRDPKRPITSAQVRGMTTCKGNKYIDNIMNYMSYTHAACYRLFTMEQTKRMQRVVDGYYNRFRPVGKPKKPAPKKKAGRRLSA